MNVRNEPNAYNILAYTSLVVLYHIPFNKGSAPLEPISFLQGTTCRERATKVTQTMTMAYGQWGLGASAQQTATPN